MVKKLIVSVDNRKSMDSNMNKPGGSGGKTVPKGNLPPAGWQGIVTQYLEFIKDGLIDAANGAQRGAIFLSGLAKEGYQYGMALSESRPVQIFLDGGLQVFFLFFLSLLVLQIALLSFLAGFIQTHCSKTGRSGNNSLMDLQNLGFTFIHQAIDCMECWICGTPMSSCRATRGSNSFPVQPSSMTKKDEDITERDTEAAANPVSMVEQYLKKRQLATASKDDNPDWCEEELDIKKERHSPSNSFISMPDQHS